MSLENNKIEKEVDIITSIKGNDNKQQQQQVDNEITTVHNAINNDLITRVNDDNNKEEEEEEDDLIITPVNETVKKRDDFITVTAPVAEPVMEAPSIMHSAKEELYQFTSKINPFTKKMNKGFYQMRQYANEKLGTAQDVTQLSQEYKDLEKRVDALCDIHHNLLKVTKTYGVQNYDYHSILGVTNTILSDNRAPKTLSHAVARAALTSANEINTEYGMALAKYAEASDKLGNARLVMDHEIVTRFNERMQYTLDTSILGVNKARKEVNSTRLALDAAKSKLMKEEEIEAAEDQFVGAVEQATHLMKSLLQDPEPLRDLSAMAEAQLAYFKEAEGLFSGLLPNLKDLLTKQETSLS